jgi:hypothetical protein
MRQQQLRSTTMASLFFHLLVQNLDLLSDPHVHRLQSASPISTMGRERRDAIDFCPAGLHSEDPRRSPFAKAIACKAFWMRVRLRTH